MVAVPPSSIADMMREQSEAWCDTPWRALDARLDEDGRYHGSYDVDMDSDVGERAPHRPLLHASLLAELVNFHVLLSMSFAYVTVSHPALAKLPRVELPEFRRRALLTGLKLSLKEPVFENPVPLVFSFDDIVDKWDRHRMLFLTGSADAAEGKHTAKIEGCFNFRDEIDF